MDIRLIKTEADHRAALAEIERLFDAVLDTPEGDRLHVLTTLVEAYEAQHYPSGAPNPIEAIVAPPIPHSYWVLPGRFLAGMHPGSTNRHDAQETLQALIQAGITVFINLAEDHGGPSYEDVLQRECAGGRFDCWRSPIPDMGTPSREQMTQILDRIDAALAAERAVYVHCLAGIGRTGTVVGCYLARHGQAGEEALREIARRRRGSPSAHIEAPETEAQRQFVRAWQPRSSSVS